ncbi:hypothetical protein AHAS_Ahas15G0099300 [Arachis hypogaea]
MASSCSRMLQRASTLSLIKSAVKSGVAGCRLSRSALPKSTSKLGRSFLIRNIIAAELGCLESMLPLHGAAASCLRSRSSFQGTLSCNFRGP